MRIQPRKITQWNVLVKNIMIEHADYEMIFVILLTNIIHRL